MVYRIQYELISHYRNVDNYPTSDPWIDGYFEFENLDNIELQVKDKISKLLEDRKIDPTERALNYMTADRMAKLIADRNFDWHMEEYVSMVFTSPLYWYDPTLPSMDGSKIFEDVALNGLMKKIPFARK